MGSAPGHRRTCSRARCTHGGLRSDLGESTREHPQRCAGDDAAHDHQGNRVLRERCERVRGLGAEPSKASGRREGACRWTRDRRSGVEGADMLLESARGWISPPRPTAAVTRCRPHRRGRRAVDRQYGGPTSRASLRRVGSLAERAQVAADLLWLGHERDEPDL